MSRFERSAQLAIRSRLNGDVELRAELLGAEAPLDPAENISTAIDRASAIVQAALSAAGRSIAAGSHDALIVTIDVRRRTPLEASIAAHFREE